MTEVNKISTNNSIDTNTTTQKKDYQPPLPATKNDTFESSTTPKKQVGIGTKIKNFFSGVHNWFYPVTQLDSGATVRHFRWNNDVKTSTINKNNATYDEVDGHGLTIDNANNLVANGKDLKINGNSGNNNFEVCGQDIKVDGKAGKDTLDATGSYIVSIDNENVNLHTQNSKVYGAEKTTITGNNNVIQDEDHKSYATHIYMQPIYTTTYDSQGHSSMHISGYIPQTIHDPIYLDIDKLNQTDPNDIEGLKTQDFNEIKEDAAQNITIKSGQNNKIRLDP